MRFRNHVATSVLAGLAVYPGRMREPILLIAGGVLLDIDHYILYALRSGDWSPLGALEYDRLRRRCNEAIEPDYGSLRSPAHSPRLMLPLLGVLGLRWRAIRPVALGVLLHLVMDARLELQLDWRVWRRAGGRCEACGHTGLRRAVDYSTPPRCGGARWALSNRVVWCCNEECQARRREAHRSMASDEH